jgi:antirestriction protein
VSCGLQQWKASRRRWIDASLGAAIQDQINEVLATSPEAGAEEWAIHDYENFGSIELSEWTGVELVSTLAKLFDEHGDAFAVWYETQDGKNFDTDELEEKFSEQYQGSYNSEVDFAEQLLEDCGQLAELPEWAKNYFDFESYARDLRLSGDYSFTEAFGQTYVFNNH